MRARRTAAHDPSLVVEVAKNDVDPLALFSERVLDWHLDVVKGDICRASRCRVGGLDGLRADVVVTLDEDDREPILESKIKVR